MSKPKRRHKIKPRYLSFVKMSEAALELDKEFGYSKEFGPAPWTFFGEIPNMPSHCIIMNKSGKFFIGYHTDNFEELSEDET